MLLFEAGLIPEFVPIISRYYVIAFAMVEYLLSKFCDFRKGSLMG